MEAMKYLYGEELEFIEDIFMENNSTENEMKKVFFILLLNQV